jgi:formate hydrogenlyase transcriptional activator
LNVFPIRVPPLRERPEDIEALTESFVDACARRMRKRVPTIPGAVKSALASYAWPGNVRELQNVLERAVILATDEIHVELPRRPVPSSTPSPRPASTSLEEVQRAHIMSVLEETRGVIGGPNGAAVRLGMKRSTLNFRIKKLGITNDGKRDRWLPRFA